LLLIGFSQTAGDARAFATRHRYRIDVNQESVAQGMANVGAGVFQGMPVSTSLSASSLHESAGARTPVASLTTGAPVLLTLPALARQPGSQAFRELDENPSDETFPGIAVLRLDSGLFFATAEALDDRVRAVIRDSEPRLHALVIDLEGVDFVDSQGAAKLAEL